ncbi:hypothetical protein TNCV_1999901 [Trichonephila clavipes]|nr:hypothetical protein TNCV_1999901 [Trichonephila clavipes]
MFSLKTVGRIEPNRIVTCLVLKASSRDRSDCFTSTTFALCLHNYQTNRNPKEDILEMINSLTMAKIQAE